MNEMTRISPPQVGHRSGSTFDASAEHTWPTPTAESTAPGRQRARHCLPTALVSHPDDRFSRCAAGLAAPVAARQNRESFGPPNVERVARRSETRIPMKALVLGAGGLKGAFQAGAVAEILKAGYVPDLIYGVSVGALNGAILADESSDPDRSWAEIGESLVEFWREHITGPEALMKKRSLIGVAWSMLWDRFDGFVDPEPFHTLMRRRLSAERISRSRAQFIAAAMNIHDGNLESRDQAAEDIIDFVFGSSAVPFLDPIKRVGGEGYVDGSVREMAPIGAALARGAVCVAAVVCQAKDLTVGGFKPGNVLQLTARIVDILTNSIVEDDLKEAEAINDLFERHNIPSAPGARERFRPVKVAAVVRPSVEITVSLQSFTPRDVAHMIQVGRDAARAALPLGC